MGSGRLSEDSQSCIGASVHNDNRVRSVAVNLPHKNKLGLIGMMVWVTPRASTLRQCHILLVEGEESISWRKEEGDDDSQSQPQEHLQSCGTIACLTSPHDFLKRFFFTGYFWPPP